MYTGLIEEIGRVRENTRAGRLSILAETVLKNMKVGDSISVNGACLTVTGFDGYSFTADVTPETLHRSTLGGFSQGELVNLERPLAADGRFGGHFVSGHVDGTGKIAGMYRNGNAVIIKIEAQPEILEFIVEKGSVAVDGISLTVAAVDDKKFTVSVIPHTRAKTTLIMKKTGDKVNLETDIIGKYVHKFLPAFSGSTGITAEFLSQNGF